MLSTTSQADADQVNQTPVDARPKPPLPPLENGDHLTRHEFERRYEATPQLKKAELVEGIVYMPSPTHADNHALPHSTIMGLLFVYSAGNPGTKALNNPTLRLDQDNEVQPDAVLMRDPAHGGKAHISADDYLEGAPELIVEIAASSTSYDLHQKLNVYRRAGVQEYLVWQVREQELHWWKLSEGLYVPLVADEAGVLHSEVFPGLWLAAPQILAGDSQAALEVLQQGIKAAKEPGD
jgi:Uma2 family endonuclease